MLSHAQQDAWPSPTLRLKPGQQALTPAQEAEAERFAEERIRTLLSTEPVHEQEAETLLRHAYQRAEIAPPKHLLWLDSPVPLVTLLTAERVGDRVESSGGASVWDSVRDSIWASFGASGEDRFAGSNMHQIRDSVGRCIWASIVDRVGASMQYRVGDDVRASVEAYDKASLLALYQFFDGYFAPNNSSALAQFNELVSGYWLGQDVALMVRRPRVLSRDAEGHLHGATGKCLEYHDGWGFYAWHGVVVPEQMILAPERLSRDDFLNEPNVEVRQVMQERMGSRFVSEMGGVVIDSSPRGSLYEVRLPTDDPERVARYVQVQDASTPRQYVLRVPPTIQTVAEAVAWSFGLPVQDYHPAQET